MSPHTAWRSPIGDRDDLACFDCADRYCTPYRRSGGLRTSACRPSRLATDIRSLSRGFVMRLAKYVTTTALVAAFCGVTACGADGSRAKGGAGGNGGATSAGGASGAGGLTAHGGGSGSGGASVSGAGGGTGGASSGSGGATSMGGQIGSGGASSTGIFPRRG
jgi:hypothetical protein